jgi:hypothetical protein
MIKNDRRIVFVEFLTKLKIVLTKTYDLLTRNPNNNGTSGKADIFL